MKKAAEKVDVNSRTRRIILLGVVATLLASLAWGANSRPPQGNGELLRVTRGGNTALVAIVDISQKARLIVRVPEGRLAATASGLLLREGGTAPVNVKCALARTSAGQVYTIQSCSGAAELSSFSAKLQQEAPRLNLRAALDPSLKGLDSGGVVQNSVEGDNCRACCYYQWQWGILACWLWNPTGGCFDQVNQFYVACVATRCPL
jgi:hypothetical protein